MLSQIVLLIILGLLLSYLPPREPNKPPADTTPRFFCKNMDNCPLCVYENYYLLSECIQGVCKLCSKAVNMNPFT